MARANDLSSPTTTASRCDELAMADTAITIWSGKRFYGSVATEVTWRPVTSIALATRRQPRDRCRSGVAAAHQHAIARGIPCRAPEPERAATTVLLSYFKTRPQTFTLTTPDSRAARTPALRKRAPTVTAARLGGMHYPSTVRISDAVGGAIAKYVNRKRHAAAD